MQRLYCYVDESGQDTKGKLFLVSVVITEQDLLGDLEKRLSGIEQESGKRQTKWRATSFDRRMAYLEAVFRLRSLQESLFYAVYQATKEYVPLTTYTIAQAIGRKARGTYQATIIIDGLNKKECQRMTRGLHQLRIKYRKVRGIKDESSPLVRLADALAGFLRDYEEGRQYAKELYGRLPDQLLTKLE